jgi:tetratricopeptide (TPR) repeat protein
MPELVDQLIPHDSLLEPGRIERRSLRPWARELHGRLVSASDLLVATHEQPDVWEEIATCMNNAALIEVFRGAPRSARALCELQLRWIDGLVRTHGLAAAHALALQPWINIGRLLRSAGNHVEALRYFSLFVAMQADMTLHLGPIVIDAATWRAVVSSKEVRTFLAAVYVIDSWKTHMAAGNHAGAVEFLRRATALTGAEVAGQLAEAEAISLARLGRYQEALDVLDREVWQSASYTKLVRVTYRVAFMAAAGQVDQTRRLLEQLAGRVLSTRLDTTPDQRVVRYLHHLGLMARCLELAGLAARIWLVGLGSARQLADVPLEVAFLESLLQIEGLENRAALAQERSALLQECLYETLLAPRGLTVDSTAAADPVFAALHDKLQEIAQRPMRAAHESGRMRIQTMGAPSTAS